MGICRLLTAKYFYVYLNMTIEIKDHVIKERVKEAITAKRHNRNKLTTESRRLLSFILMGNWVF
jgi:hypothetical protein